MPTLFPSARCIFHTCVMWTMWDSDVVIAGNHTVYSDQLIDYNLLYRESSCTYMCSAKRVSVIFTYFVKGYLGFNLSLCFSSIHSVNNDKWYSVIIQLLVPYLQKEWNRYLVTTYMTYWTIFEVHEYQEYIDCTLNSAVLNLYWRFKGVALHLFWLCNMCREMSIYIYISGTVRSLGFTILAPINLNTAKTVVEFARIQNI